MHNTFELVVFLSVLGLTIWLPYRLWPWLIPAFQNRRFRIAYWLITLLSFVSLLAARWLFPPGFPGEFLFPACAWIVALLVSLPLLLLLRTGAALSFRKPEPVRPAHAISRRAFLKKTAALAPLAAVGFGAKGVMDSLDLVTNRYQLAFPSFPAQTTSLKIAQISDTHVGIFFSVNRLEQTLTKVLAEKPDLLVITGDLIDDIGLLEQTMALLENRSSRFPYGIFFCWGNHEYFRNPAKIREALKKTSITLLENQHAAISFGGRRIYLAGVDYPWGQTKQEHQEICSRYLASALDGIPPGAFTVLLSHHPDLIDDAFSANIPLTLTGHTHGGQLGLFGKSVLPIYQYMRGMYEKGAMKAYVSTGTGHWFPFRFDCPAEITIYEISGV